MTSETRSTPLELAQEITPASCDGHAAGQEMVHIMGLDRLPPLALGQYLLSHFVSFMNPCMFDTVFVQYGIDSSLL
jgi:hypothetical protein